MTPPAVTVYTRSGPPKCMGCEEWRPVHLAEFEAIYEISNRGNLRSLDREVIQRDGRARRFAGKNLRLSVSSGGYRKTVLRNGGHSQNVTASRLVCWAFHGPPPSDAHEVRHLNGVSGDDRAENLAWGTKSENERDKIAHGTHWLVNKTHCPSGHEYTPDNTYRLPSHPSYRYCRACHRAASRRARANASAGVR